MKKFLFFILLSFSLFYNSYSQNITKEEVIQARDYLCQSLNKYLTIKGVELRPMLTMKDLFQSFLAKGWEKSILFDLYYSEYSAYSLTGSFFQKPFCEITMLPLTSDKNIVGCIGINFSNSDTFKQLKYEYDELKAALSKKYNLASSEEYFDNKDLQDITSDYLKLKALENNECKFTSTFYLKEDVAGILGFIRLSISYIKVNYDKKYYVSLTYVTSDSVIEQLFKGEDDL